MRGPVLGPDGSYESAVAMRSRGPRPDRARGAKRRRSKPNRTIFVCVVIYIAIFLEVGRSEVTSADRLTRCV